MRDQRGRSVVVLLAEDDPGDQEMTRRALQEGVFDINLHIVSDGEMALDYLHHRGEYSDPAKAPEPDLMLLDLNMPKVDGKQVLQHMSSDAFFRRIPVVVLTTSSQETDIVRAYDLGCKSYITKPVNVDGFFKCIQDLGLYWFELVTLPS